MLGLVDICFHGMMTSSLALTGLCGNGGHQPAPTPPAADSSLATAPSRPVATPPTQQAAPTQETRSSNTVAAAPTQAPVPEIAHTAFDDAEYRLSGTNSSAHAISAYNAGATGAGIKIAIVDSGLSDPRGEFAARIDSISRDMISGRGIGDDSGHGTSVAAVAAAGRNGSDIMGVAFDATLLIERADNAGSCVSLNSCSYNNDVLARSVDYARTNGARIINLSLGGSAPNKALLQAVQNATAAGIVVVVAAGNDGAMNPTALAQIAGKPNANGLVVIVGSHNADYQISSFSNRAGSYSQYYLTALGENVRAFNNAGIDMMFSGTSYSAPAVSGAVALLLQAFPNLTGRQVLDLLYSTASDAGAAGADSVYGQGILNLTKAFEPQGATKVAGSETPISTVANGTLSSAMGDAATASNALPPTVVLVDAYSRAYALNLASTLQRKSSGSSLPGKIRGSFRGTQLSNGPLRMTFNMVERGARANGFASDSARIGQRQNAMRMLSGRGDIQLSKKTQILFGLAETGNRLSGLVDQREELPYLVAQDIDVSMGFDSRDVRSLAVSHSFGSTKSAFWVESGSAGAADARNRTATGYQMAGLRLSRRIAEVTLSGGATLMREKGTLLGARFGKALGGGGASTRMLDVRASWAIARGWTLGSAYRQAWTSADRTEALVGGRLTSNALSVDVSHSNAHHRMGLRIAQPLRVTSSHYVLELPTSLDLASGTVSRTRQTLNLKPQGREIDVEASYGRKLGMGWIDANLFLRREPGNIAAASADRGATVRYRMEF